MLEALRNRAGEKISSALNIWLGTRRFQRTCSPFGEVITSTVATIAIMPAIVGTSLTRHHSAQMTAIVVRTALVRLFITRFPCLFRSSHPETVSLENKNGAARFEPSCAVYLCLASWYLFDPFHAAGGRTLGVNVTVEADPI